MVSIRILRPGAERQEWITRFGFDAEKHPAVFDDGLWGWLVTPMQMASKRTRYLPTAARSILAGCAHLGPER